MNKALSIRSAIVGAFAATAVIGALGMQVPQPAAIGRYQIAVGGGGEAQAVHRYVLDTAMGDLYRVRDINNWESLGRPQP